MTLSRDWQHWARTCVHGSELHPHMPEWHQRSPGCEAERRKFLCRNHWSQDVQEQYLCWRPPFWWFWKRQNRLSADKSIILTGQSDIREVRNAMQCIESRAILVFSGYYYMHDKTGWLRYQEVKDYCYSVQCSVQWTVHSAHVLGRNISLLMIVLQQCIFNHFSHCNEKCG